jgi:hypothetical protein
MQRLGASCGHMSRPRWYVHPWHSPSHGSLTRLNWELERMLEWSSNTDPNAGGVVDLRLYTSGRLGAPLTPQWGESSRTNLISRPETTSGSSYATDVPVPTGWQPWRRIKKIHIYGSGTPERALLTGRRRRCICRTCAGKRPALPGALCFVLPPLSSSTNR